MSKIKMRILKKHIEPHLLSSANKPSFNVKRMVDILKRLSVSFMTDKIALEQHWDFHETEQKLTELSFFFSAARTQ